MASARRPRAGRQRGLSLVEILVALSVGTLLAGAGLALAQIFAQVHREQSQIQTLTDNLRGALMQVATDARLAGAGMPGGDAVNAATASPVQVPDVRVVNSSTGPDRLELLTAPGSALATTLTATMPGSTSIIVDAAGGASFAAGDFVLLSDFNRGVLYQVQGVSAVTISGVTTRALGVLAAPGFPVSQFGAGSLVLRASVVRYSVGLGSAVGLPATSVLLVEDGAPIGAAAGTSLAAENVFDLQVALGIDGAGGQPQDGALTEIGVSAGDDEWVFNVPGEALPAAPYALRAVRISIVGRTPVTSPTRGPGRPAAEDRAAGAPDNFRWRLQRQVVMVRNKVIR